MDGAGVRLCEVGPGAVRALHPAPTVRADPALADAALQAIGEPLALLGERPVDTAQLWQRVLEPLLAGHSEVVLVHPSWWSPGLVDTVVTAAAGLTAAVHARPRYRLLHRGTAFVEIGPDTVVVGGDDDVAGAETRCMAVDEVVDAVLARLPGRGPLNIDAPAGVPGADALATLIARRQRADGRPVRRLGDSHLIAAARAAAPVAPPASPGPPPRRRTSNARNAVAAGAGLALLATVAAGMATTRETGYPTTELVEGRVAMQVPADWPVRRVTDGPGSARVEVTSPTDAEVVLHLTQSPSPTTDLAATAAALRTAAEDQPAGVFVDFNPDDHRAGRPAVTYRERRESHDIDWSVVIAGSTRIAIGCQSAPGRRAGIERACEQAIASAREIG